MPMYWETTPASGTWRLTKDLWVWDAGQWKSVKQCYIHTGGGWALCHAAASSLNSFILYNTASFCDPTIGNFQANWTYTTGDPASWDITIEYSFNYGASWGTYASNIDVSLGSYSGSLDGLFGFSSLDSTYFRLSMTQGSTHADLSPRLAYPTFPCL